MTILITELCVPFINFYGFKMFSIFISLKISRKDFVYEVHTLGILSQKSSAQGGVESEANNLISPR